MTHLLRDPLLAIPSHGALSSAYHGENLDLIREVADWYGEGNYDLPKSIRRRLREWFELHVRVYPGRVVEVPLFCVAFAKALAEEFDDHPREVNSEEESDYQMPEIVLREACPVMHMAMQVYKERILDPVTLVLFGMQTRVTRSIQMARYSAGGISQGNFHTDAVSDITYVTSIGDRSFKGGGTRFFGVDSLGRHHPVAPASLPGRCLIFPGKTLPHMGEPVTEGRRDILVWWTEFEEREEWSK